MFGKNLRSQFFKASRTVSGLLQSSFEYLNKINGYSALKQVHIKNHAKYIFLHTTILYVFRKENRINLIN